MPKRSNVPDALKSGPFAVEFAARHGVTEKMLSGPNYRRLFRGVYVWIGRELAIKDWLVGGLLTLPCDAVVSHVTALWLFRIEIGPQWPLHFSTNTLAVTEQPGIELHRRLGTMSPRRIDTVPVLGPDRTFVDVATHLGLVHLVQVAEMLLYLRLTTLESLWDFALGSHLDGVVRARRALVHVREGAESPMESLIRLMVVFAGLPEPEPNRDIVDEHGNFVARGDMVYSRWKVLVEYDGWHHERSAKQRQRDRERREALEALGWRVIVVTSADLVGKQEIVRRVHRAIRDRGYSGPPPRLNARWNRRFSSI